MYNKMVNYITRFIQTQKLRKQVLEIHTNDQREKERRERVRKAFQNGDFRK